MVFYDRVALESVIKHAFITASGLLVAEQRITQHDMNRPNGPLNCSGIPLHKAVG